MAVQQVVSPSDHAAPQRPPTPAEIDIMYRKEQELASEIYKQIVVNFGTMSNEARTEIFTTHYPNFLKCHPVVCKWMVLHGMFNLKAMQKYMNLNRKSPPKSMEDSMRNSAQYVKYLYIESAKASGQHYSAKRAVELASAEERELFAEYKRIKKQEAEARNSFEEEAIKHAAERRDDILAFIRTHAPEEAIVLTPEEIALQRELLGLTTPETPAPAPIELVRLQYRDALARIAELESELEVKTCQIERREEHLLAVAKRMLAEDTSDWLRGTSAAPKVAPAIQANVTVASGVKKSRRKGKR